MCNQNLDPEISDCRIMFSPQILTHKSYSHCIISKVCGGKKGGRGEIKRRKEGMKRRGGGNMETEKIRDRDLVIKNVIRVTFKFVRFPQASAYSKNEHCQNFPGILLSEKLLSLSHTCMLGSCPLTSYISRSHPLPPFILRQGHIKLPILTLTPPTALHWL